MTQADLDVAFARAKDAVLRAGELIARNISQPKDVTRKGRIDLVTDTDMAVERSLKESLAAILPGALFLAEETSASQAVLTDAGNDAPVWIIDPVDGTTNFAHGFPFVCISLALWRGGRTEFGFVHAPVLGETFSARRGAGAYLGEKRISVSQTDALEDALAATGFPYAIDERIDQTMANLRRALLACQGIRRPGSAALDLAYVACGRFDAFYETGLKPWDVAAGWLLVEEAGGLVSQFAGARESYHLGAETILATNGKLHLRLGDLLEWPSAARPTSSVGG